MALLRSRLFAGALFAGALFGAAQQSEQPVEQTPVAQSPGGGSSYESGRGWVKTSDGWVRGLKVVRTDTAVYGVAPATGATAFVGETRTRSISFIATPLAINSVYGSINATSCGAYCHDYDVSSGAEVGCVTTSAVAEAARDVQWLSADELLVVLEEVWT